MPPDQELLAWLKLGLIAELTHASFRKLLGEFRDPEAVCAADRSALGRIVPNEVADAILRGPDATRVDVALRWLEEPGNRIISLADAAYPRLLLEITDPPPLLYVKGDSGLLNRAALAVVGSRNATPQGSANAEDLGRELSDGGFTIISGLALGIDAAAHRGGLAGASSSLAVVGTGLDIVYPARNRALAHQLAAQGALVSEFPLGTPALSGISAAQPLDQRTGARLSDRRSRAQQRIADHCALCTGAGTRGVRDPRFDPLAAFEGLSPAHQARRETGRKQQRYSGRTRRRGARTDRDARRSGCLTRARRTARGARFRPA
jgi:hypothetical protein